MGTASSSTPPTSLTEPEQSSAEPESPSRLTESQQKRRERMLAAAAELAVEGGWDAVQMREVAQRAEVALGTLYRYFPSKEFLLVSVMIRDIEGLADRLSVRPPRGAAPVERVVDVLRRANRALLRQQLVTIAMIRALVSGNQDIAPAVRRTRVLMRRIISDAVGGDTDAGHDGSTEATPEEQVDPHRLDAVDLLADVWLAALVSWISGVDPVSSLDARLEQAARLLLD